MKRLYAALATATAALGWLSAYYWRQRAGWSSDAEIDAMLARAESDVVTTEEPEVGREFGYASAFCVRASEPPHDDFPWFAGVAWTDFEVDDDGLRITRSDYGWCRTQSDGWALIAARGRRHQPARRGA